MGMPLKDRSGQRVGNLVVLSRGETRGKSVFWLCRCDCGIIKEIASCSLNPGNTVSCGCHRRAVASKTAKTLSFKHGGSYKKLYRIWACMRDRCNNPNAVAYAGYGGRNITVCNAWNDFSVFEKWAMESGYKQGLSIDRIDNNDGYSPVNCRWSTQKEQSNNRRSNIFIEHDQQKLTVAQWAERLGVNRHTLYARLKSGMSVSEALSTPIKKRRNISC